MTTKDDFADKIVNYVKTHPRYDEFTVDEAARVAVNVLLHDIGAANDFLRAIGVDIDLYTYEASKERPLTNKVDVDLETDRVMVVPMKNLPHGPQSPEETAAVLSAWGFDPSREISWQDDWTTGVRVFKQKKEVSSADRAEGTPEGSDQVSEQREDSLRRSRER